MTVPRLHALASRTNRSHARALPQAAGFRHGASQDQHALHQPPPLQQTHQPVSPDGLEHPRAAADPASLAQQDQDRNPSQLGPSAGGSRSGRPESPSWHPPEGEGGGGGGGEGRGREGGVREGGTRKSDPPRSSGHAHPRHLRQAESSNRPPPEDALRKGSGRARNAGEARPLEAEGAVGSRSAGADEAGVEVQAEGEAGAGAEDKSKPVRLPPKRTVTNQVWGLGAGGGLGNPCARCVFIRVPSWSRASTLPETRAFPPGGSLRRRGEGVGAPCALLLSGSGRMERVPCDAPPREDRNGSQVSREEGDGREAGFRSGIQHARSRQQRRAGGALGRDAEVTAYRRGVTKHVELSSPRAGCSRGRSVR